MPTGTPAPERIALPAAQLAPAPPPPAPGTYAVTPRYDIAEAARRDAVVRRIVWLCALVVALGIAAFVASHL
jgi:hypothetical protein